MGHARLEPPVSVSMVDRGLSPIGDFAIDNRAEWIKLCNLQRRILPKTAPQISGYQQVFAYRPAFLVTGDYHDFFRRHDDQSAVFVGDGSGHGPAASMLMAMMYAIFHTHPELHREPGETLTRAGQLFSRLIPSDLFMTGVYVLLGAAGRVSWSAAGHHPPLRFTAAGQLFPVDLAQVGPILGLDPNDRYETVTWELSIGERLLLFTDGLWEARSPAGEKFSLNRLYAHMEHAQDRPLEEVVPDLVATAAAHMEGADFEDDFTVVGIERRQ
jgi:sigma-B regulation protein RsbU (phosphoserine phosphatase)